MQDFFHDLFQFIHFSIKKINLSVSTQTVLRPLDMNDKIHCLLEYASLLKNLPDYYEKSDRFIDIADYFIDKSIELLSFYLENSYQEKGSMNDYKTQLMLLDSMIHIAENTDETSYSKEINQIILTIEAQHSCILTERTRTINACISYLFHLHEFLDIPWLPGIFMEYGAELHNRICEEGIYKKFDSDKVADLKTTAETITALQYCYLATDFALFQESASILITLLEGSPLFKLLRSEEMIPTSRTRIHPRDITSSVSALLSVKDKTEIETYKTIFYFLLNTLKMFELDEHHCTIYSYIESHSSSPYVRISNEEAEEFEYLLFIRTFSKIAKTLY